MLLLLNSNLEVSNSCPTFDGKPFKKICDGHTEFIHWHENDGNGLSDCRNTCERHFKTHGVGCCEARTRPSNTAYCRYYPNGRIEDSKPHGDTKAVICSAGILKIYLASNKV